MSALLGEILNEEEIDPEWRRDKFAEWKSLGSACEIASYYFGRDAYPCTTPRWLLPAQHSTADARAGCRRCRFMRDGSVVHIGPQAAQAPLLGSEE